MVENEKRSMDGQKEAWMQLEIEKRNDSILTKVFKIWTWKENHVTHLHHMQKGRKKQELIITLNIKQFDQ